MWIEVVTSDNFNDDLIEILDGLRGKIVDEVLVPNLHVAKDIGDGEFYVKKCTTAKAKSSFCAVKLQGVSVRKDCTYAKLSNKKDRTYEDLLGAMKNLKRIYFEILKGRNLYPQLFVLINLDIEHEAFGTSLIEGIPICVP